MEERRFICKECLEEHGKVCTIKVQYFTDYSDMFVPKGCLFPTGKCANWEMVK